MSRKILSFEWDPRKERANLRKHRVAFRDALHAFYDPFSLTIEDSWHSTDEEKRRILIGASRDLRLLVVVHTERYRCIRIISARRATRSEQEHYERQDRGT